MNCRTIDIAALEKPSYILKSIASPIRLGVIMALAGKEAYSVSDLVSIIKCEQSLLSHHITDMRAKGILSMRKEGKKSYYSIANEDILKVVECMCDCEKLII